MDKEDVNVGPSEAKKQKLECDSEKLATTDSDKSNNDNKTTVGDGNNSVAVDDDKEKPVDYTQTQKEVDVGITKYVSKLPGFSGVIKQRYSDFLVNEVNTDGQVVRLTSTDLPCPLPDTEVKVDSTVVELIGEEKAEECKSLLENKDAAKSVLISVSDNKELRTKIHSCIAKAFPGLETATVTKEDDKYIEVKITTNRGSGLRNWPKGRGDYCKFVLYKENSDTMNAISLLATRIRVKNKLFQYSGTKDRRAKTSQEVTAYRLAPEKLKEAHGKLRNIVTGNYSYVSKPLRLGCLNGNQFTIILRSVTGTEAEIKSGMESLRDTGFINYFGMQRFGSGSIPSHHIGRSLLQGDWKTAVELILKPRQGDDKMLTEARQLWWDTRNHRQAINKLPHSAYIERNILYGLVDSNTDYMGALNKLARNTRLLYAHAYQSYVWNTVTSARVREHGLQVTVGDLVLTPETQLHKDETEEESVSDVSSKCKPVIVDDSNIDSYSIYDVVLPLPGYDVVYPSNKLRDQYKELMEKDSLNYEDMRRRQKDYSLSGAYRHILIRPKDVSWKTHRYDDPKLPLVLSDWARLQGKSLPEPVQEGGSLALELQLTLPTSCYATMALREVLKIDTSSGHQATLNDTG